MDIESAKAKYFGKPSEHIKDGKLVLNTTESVKQTTGKFNVTEGNITFTPRGKQGPRRSITPELRVVTNTKEIQNSNPKQAKFNSPKELVLSFTAGTVDYTFPNGDGFGFDKNTHDIKVQPDGKILVAGDFEYYDYSGDTYFSPFLIRLNADGTFDNTFDTTNDGANNGFNAAIYTIHLQEDGKIVVGGDFTYYDKDLGYTTNRIARLNPDGSYDNTYAVGNGFDNSVYKIEVQGDGKTVIGGVFTQFNGNGFNRIVRLNSNGSVDSSFLVTNGFNNGDYGYVNEIKQQPDGKLLVGGYFDNYDSNSANNITRLNTNGTIDTAFNIGNGFDGEVTSIVLQSDNNIIVGGFFEYFDNNYLYGGNILKLNGFGEMDTMFGYGLNNGVISLAIQSDDKILVGGFQTEFYPDGDSTITCNRLMRFHKDCTLDYSYYFDDIFLTDGIYSIAILDDDMILIGGEFDTDGDPTSYPINHFGRINNKVLEYPYVLKFIDCGVQTNLDNYQDFTYVVGSNTPFDFNKTYSFSSLENPSQTFCGYFAEEYPSVDVKFVKVNEYNDCADGLFDNSKLVELTPYLGSYPYSPNLLVDKRYEVGDYLFYSNLTIDGGSGEAVYLHGTFQITAELPFDNSNTFDKIVPYIPYETGDESIEANGQYVVTFDCETADEELILTYQPSLIFKYITQPNGESYCKEAEFDVSFFSPYFDDIISYENLSAGTPTLNSSLSFDTCSECLAAMSIKGNKDYGFYDGGFNGGLSEGPMVFKMIQQPDGKILVAGDFEEYDGVTMNSLMRINLDGTIDNTFFQGGLDGIIKAIYLQTDGKILVGGQFNTYDGNDSRNLVRLNSDGTYDDTFFVNSVGFEDTVRAIAVQNDGKILVGGDFTEYKGVEHRRIVRLNDDATVDETFNVGSGFSNRVFTIKVERKEVFPFYNDGYSHYEETILVGGSFVNFNGNESRGLAHLDTNGNLINSFGIGLTDLSRVFELERLSDGKLLIAGGFSEYNNEPIPYGILRLNSDYTIDTTFQIPNYTDDNGGFNGWVVDFEVLPNGKIMVGGQFNEFTDNNGTYTNTGYLVRLNSDGTYDDSFTFKITENYVNKIIYLSDKTILAGGWFDTPSDKLVKVFVGGEYDLRTFSDCDGNDSYILTTPITESLGSGDGVTEIPFESISTSGLDLVFDGNEDDSNFVIELPIPFDVNFLGTNYTSVNVSSNPFITFGDPNSPGAIPGNCCFDIPNEIPGQVGLPGVFVSFACPSGISDYDANLYQLYSGLTDGGNTMVIKYVGSDHCDDIATLVYGFKFYKDNSNYFDLIIESNTQFFNNDPTGGVSNAVDGSWVYTFDSSPSKAYRIGNYSSTIISKGNINTTPSVCGEIGSKVNVATPTGGIPGSMYFDGTNGVNLNVDYNVAMDLDFGSWTIEWFQYFTSPNSCCMRVFDIGTFGSPLEHVAASIEDGTIHVWLEGNSYTFTLNTPVLNTWSHIAITSENIGDPNRTLRVFQDGNQIGGDVNIDFDLNNFDGPTLLPLTIGSMGDGTSAFQGYITNFRWNKGTCYYTGNFTPPTSPLSVDYSQLLLLASDSSNLYTDTSGSQTITNNGVTWSSFNPFGKTYNLYVNTDSTVYDDCDECNSTIDYKATLYVRDGVNPDKIEYAFMKKSSIDNVLALGPITTVRGTECYELLKYYL